MPQSDLSACAGHWGKARPADTSSRWHLLAHHSLDVAAVGMAAFQHAPGLKSHFTSRLGIPAELIGHWIGFWLALHDLGKFAESFQGQCLSRDTC